MSLPPFRFLAVFCVLVFACQGCTTSPSGRWRFLESGTDTLRLGISVDEIRKVYGSATGYEGGGHGFSYAYKDEGGRGCLILDIQDKGVETLILRETRRAPPASKSVILREGDLRTSRGLSLGDPPGKVERILGKPHEARYEGNKLTYAYHASVEECSQVGCCYDGFYEFEDGRLVEISLHDGC